MHEHQISEMVESLTKAGLVQPERKKEAEAVLSTCWADKMALTWTVGDVLDVCPGLSEEEARHVLKHVLLEHDASIGVNWDVVQLRGTQLYGDRAGHNPEDDEGKEDNEDGEDGSDPDNGNGHGRNPTPGQENKMSEQKQYPRLMATFRPQAWINDQAVDTDGRVPFDATGALLALPLERIRSFQEYNHDSDDLAAGLPAREDHSGPFEVDTDIDGWLEANGLHGSRVALTKEHLDVLRERFGVRGE
jgi:hypothetical protein